ncbi:iron chelate uptake ABC transporter family permease subunit, partial [Salmonella enterica]|nr:iron chelate uptake ABC transporter family permease subunit [Salmonella enterica]
MSCSFSVTRAFAVPGLLLLLSLAAVLSLVIGAKPLPAAVVLEAFTGVCQRILGVNNGASFAIVLGAALFGFSTPLEQLFMAFSGALIASLIVAFTGSQGGGQLSPVRLTLAGVALGAVLEGLTSGIALLNPEVYDQLRFWQAGSLDIRSLQTLKV